ncbi:MAG TPA: RNA polymerase sigma factor [Usitatibacter sp.]|nr:RNA polymerase sigma factor [Usitatibacter sp.]
MTAEQQRRIAAEIEQRKPRLRSFIRGRVADVADADDILQDVLFELVESYRAPQPVEQVGAWLFRVARNRIADFFRKKRPEALADAMDGADEDGLAGLEDLLPSPEAGPEAAYARSVLLEELESALAELPAEQREAFIATEIEGLSFKDLAARTGEGVNTLLSRKRYAVLHLRERLRDIYEEIVEGE